MARRICGASLRAIPITSRRNAYGTGLQISEGRRGLLSGNGGRRSAESIVDPNLLIRRINLTACKVVDESEAKQYSGAGEQLDIFTDYAELERKRAEEKAALEREKNMQKAVLELKKKYGKISTMH